MKRRFDAIRSRIWNTEDEGQIMALYEEAIVLADKYLTENDAYQTRMDYTNKAVEYGLYDKMLVSFSWCWSTFNKHPERYSAFYILWNFKWVVENLRKCALFSAEQLEQLFKLFKEQCEKYSYSLRPYYEAYMHYLLHSGKEEEARQYYHLWRNAKNDSLTNCRACEQHAAAGYYFSKGHYKRGMQLVKPILEGKITCRSVPESTYESLILPLVALGRYEEAATYANKAFRSLSGSGHLYEFGTLLAFYSVINRRRAHQIFRNCYAEALSNVNDWDKLHYLVGAQFYLEQCEGSLKRKRKTESNEQGIDKEYVQNELERLITSFDSRSQNSYMRSRVGNLRKQYANLVKCYCESAK